MVLTHSPSPSVTPSRMSAASAESHDASRIHLRNSATSGVSMIYPDSASNVDADSLHKCQCVIGETNARRRKVQVK